MSNNYYLNEVKIHDLNIVLNTKYKENKGLHNLIINNLSEMLNIDNNNNVRFSFENNDYIDIYAYYDEEFKYKSAWNDLYLKEELIKIVDITINNYIYFKNLKRY